MSSGANVVHGILRQELENYIKTQYFGKSQLLLEAVSGMIDREGELYQQPYIESSPAYKSIKNGIQSADLPFWIRDLFTRLADCNLGVYYSPFAHQLKALELAYKGKDLFISTGTGSGKTECFVWPLIAKLALEARVSSTTWAQRGVRAILMYPMNALVSDQLSRLRRLIGDPNGKFTKIFKEYSDKNARRPQFGMYTGRTPYPGPETARDQDRQLEKTLSRMLRPQPAAEPAEPSALEDYRHELEYYEKLLNDGKIPAKSDLARFLEGLHDGKHVTADDDAELLTRFEMQQLCPDILITNYSMLEYMLLRPRERRIWNDTKEWLNSSRDNKLLFIIDEAHMYRGSSGGEVALLIRRLFYKLGIHRNRVQFILTTASMPNSSVEDGKAVRDFAEALTATDNDSFEYINGEHENLTSDHSLQIEFTKFVECNVANFEGSDETRLDEINRFWDGISSAPASFNSFPAACIWMYDHLKMYDPFIRLIRLCRGSAISLKEIAANIFPEQLEAQGLQAVSVLLALAPMAKDDNDSVLFPARMHMLFRGIRGVYACTNENCQHNHTDGSLTLGEIFISDSNLVCPHCNSIVYELLNDRRCGAVYYKGFILESDKDRNGRTYLWHYTGQLFDASMKEIHLFIPDKKYSVPSKQGKNKIRPCYLDTQSGFINFRDDSLDNKPGIRKLYYCDYPEKGRPDILTFPTCPHCHHLLSKAQLTSFSTRGNQSFFNLIKAQFNEEPPVRGKTNRPDKYPNEGRKVLLFSDSRQRAARLARDMSIASDDIASRQLIMLAIKEMENCDIEQCLSNIYGFFIFEAAKRYVQLFDRPDEQNSEGISKFAEDCNSVQTAYDRNKRRNRPYIPKFTIDDAPSGMKEQIINLFCGSYNTLTNAALSWIEPTDEVLVNAMDDLEDNGIHISEEAFKELFNGWILDISDKVMALGHSLSDDIRYNVRKCYGGYGLSEDWAFSTIIRTVMGWEDNSSEDQIWRRVLKNNFLERGQANSSHYYINFNSVKTRFMPEHEWFRCHQCSELTAFSLRGNCPSCGSDNINVMQASELISMEFWRKPVFDAIEGAAIRVINTQEHTAQLSHKDQRDAMWSKTELYELQFQDLVKRHEPPVDILSSTTTMEVGIDIGSLVAVGLRNIPPMRENYQQRAGRAGRRGASLSTIVTFCEDGPHDTLYFNDPVPMFRGDPRRPWIDITSVKLIHRHMGMVAMQEFLSQINESMDTMSTVSFVDKQMYAFDRFLKDFPFEDHRELFPSDYKYDRQNIITELMGGLSKVKEKRDLHPELYGDEETPENRKKPLLDALYEEGIIPTYSFPKNVVSTYISDRNGKLQYQVERGLDIAINEYAPGRSIVVDKETYQIGGLYYTGAEKRKQKAMMPARTFMDDPNYVKRLMTCHECGWFGLEEDHAYICPFCGNKSLSEMLPMVRPWGFAPRDARPIPAAQLDEQYTSTIPPLYSTLPDLEAMQTVPDSKRIRIASRTNQRIIMMNQGVGGKGFMICSDCGAAMPGDELKVLEGIGRPYTSNFAKSRCKHNDAINVNLGFDFVTDMLVIEISLDRSRIDTQRIDNPWLNRAAVSLAEAIRLKSSQKLDIEFIELVTGYRIRENRDETYIDIYLYDSLSSGAGYSASIAKVLPEILTETKQLLADCICDNACHNCLKHHRNQYIHGSLDRIAALELLKWGISETIAPSISVQKQVQLLNSLQNILHEEGIDILVESNKLILKNDIREKEIAIYPAMWASQKNDVGAINISDAMIKYAKPYALQAIIEKMQ